MSTPPIAVPARFPLVRDASGAPVPLPGGGEGRSVFLAVDRQRWGLVRLHLLDPGRVEWAPHFGETLAAFAGPVPGALTRVLDWAGEGDVAFVAETFPDGEPLPDYLARTGRIPPATAAGWVLEWLGESAAAPPVPALSPDRILPAFEVGRRRDGRPFLVFSVCQAGVEIPSMGPPRPISDFGPGLFGGLVSGGATGALPGSLPGAGVEVPRRLLGQLGEMDPDPVSFREALVVLAGPDAADHEAPLQPMREWMARELEAFAMGDPPARLPLVPEAGESAYTISTRIRGAEARLLVLPGPPSIPHEGWIDQHHQATRRPGRGRVNQVQILSLEDGRALTLVGEERVAGIDLESWLAAAGPLSREEVIALGARLQSILDQLESRPGTAPVRWLPPGNVFLLTGSTDAAAAVGQAESRGDTFWSDTPLKVRLHQTIETLLEGVDLPALPEGEVTEDEESGKLWRRAVVALPLVWRLLTGAAFSWSRELRSTVLPDEADRHLDGLRRRLLGEGALDESANLFLSLESIPWDPDRPVPPFPPGSTTGATESEGDLESPDKKVVHPAPESSLPAGAVPQEGFPAVGLSAEESPSSFLPEVSRDLVPASSAPVRSTSRQNEAASEPAPDDRPERSLAWGWITVWSIVFAAAVGFFLHGWSWNRGLYPAEAVPEFSLPDPAAEPVTAAAAREQLGDFLLAEGSGESLRLLSSLEGAAPSELLRRADPWLSHLSAGGNAAAARVRALLGLSAGEAGDLTAGWLLEAARGGDLEAARRFALGFWGQSGRALSAEGGDLLERAASGGHAGSQELWGRWLLERGEAEAGAEWLERAARQGRVTARHDLAVCQASGIGMARDPGLAAAGFRGAAEAGVEAAMYDYGRCLAGGFGVPPSHPEAIRWMRLAADRGHREARLWLEARGENPRP